MTTVDPKDASLLLLRGVGVAHARGLERLRLSCGLAPSGGYWRLTLAPAESFDPSDSTGRRLHGSARDALSWSTGSVPDFHGLTLTMETTPEEVADHLEFVLPASMVRGSDPAYAAWLAEAIDESVRVHYPLIAFSDSWEPHAWQAGGRDLEPPPPPPPPSARPTAEAARPPGPVAPEGLPTLRALRGDVTKLPCDAIVNAANNAMRGGGGVDGAIHRAGGPDVLADCVARFPRGLATGDAGWTTSGRLPSRWIIHTVGPNYAAGPDPRLLESCYRRALQVADEVGARTVAFPLISAGVYGWPREDAIARAIATIRATPSQANGIRLVAFDDETYRQVQRALR